ncbi:hypothetical protein BGX38DRAFT_606940 [Terfezia claveryi]|nr:hypothetical protein BGX38DRAFT_606940 [Terfezia claveryi]
MLFEEGDAALLLQNWIVKRLEDRYQRTVSGANCRQWTHGGAAMGAASPTLLYLDSQLEPLGRKAPWQLYRLCKPGLGWLGCRRYPPWCTSTQRRNRPSAGAGAQRKPVERKISERYGDYDEKGYCMQGGMCGANDEYDPDNSQLFPAASKSAVHLNGAIGAGGSVADVGAVQGRVLVAGQEEGGDKEEVGEEVGVVEHGDGPEEGFDGEAIIYSYQFFASWFRVFNQAKRMACKNKYGIYYPC